MNQNEYAPEPIGATKLARQAARRVLLARRQKNNLPWGTSTASVAASRNLLYLSSKGLADDPKNPRMAAELTLDNTRRANLKDQRQNARGVLQAGQAEANKHFRRGSSSIPARKAAARAAARA